MISSPGCVCLTGDASGPISMRCWTTSHSGDAQVMLLQIGALQFRRLLYRRSA
jgi:hypothetical protein